ncbi:MAG TPA: hypothetical protein VK165_09420 [Azonexus sp.]|nr:hypothetical protein [Azonexus sp.]
MHLKAKQAFSWAHRGVEIEEFAKGQNIETEDKDLIEVSLAEGWTEKAKAPTKAERKAALQAQVKQLESDLADAADDAAEQAIEAQLAEVKQQLVSLG